jgi:hypothetical protein
MRVGDDATPTFRHFLLGSSMMPWIEQTPHTPMQELPAEQRASAADVAAVEQRLFAVDGGDHV